MKTLTEIQQTTYDWIIKFYRENGKPPTFREISDNFSITVKASHDRVSLLKKKHFLTTNNSPRGIRLSKYDIKITLTEKGND